MWGIPGHCYCEQTCVLCAHAICMQDNMEERGMLENLLQVLSITSWQKAILLSPFRRNGVMGNFTSFVVEYKENREVMGPVT